MPRNEIISLLSSLIEIDSSNAFLVPGSPGERGVQLYMKDYLHQLGVEAVMEPVDGGYTNLAGCLKGAGGGKNITLYAHCDTVGYAAWKDRALKPRVEDGRLYGLGSCDDKGHCVAILLVIKRLVEEGAALRGDVNFCLVADEEGESAGAFGYVRMHTPTAALVYEPSPIHRVTTEHQGFGWVNIIVKGRAAHGCAPEQAIDSITRMAEIIVRLQRHQREHFAKNPHPLNGETVFHNSLISGGSDFATYPAYCKLGIEIGTQPGETLDTRINEIQAIFDEVRDIYPDLDASIEVLLERSPFIGRGQDEIFALYARELERVSGKKAERAGANFWGDAQVFMDAGFPTIQVGALGGEFHAIDEWISLDELEQIIDIAVGVIKAYCA